MLFFSVFLRTLGFLSAVLIFLIGYYKFVSPILVEQKEKINLMETFWIGSGFTASKEKLLSLLS